MNKKQKIKLLKEIMEGKRKISDADQYEDLTFTHTIIGPGGKIIAVETETIRVEKDPFNNE